MAPKEVTTLGLEEVIKMWIIVWVVYTVAMISAEMTIENLIWCTWC